MSCWLEWLDKLVGWDVWINGESWIRWWVGWTIWSTWKSSDSCQNAISHLHLERRDQSGIHCHCPQVDSESEATNMRMILEWCQRVPWQGCSILLLQCYSTPSQTRGSQGTWSKHQPKSSEPTDLLSPSIREDHVKAFFHNFKPFQPPGIVDQNQNMKHVKHLIHWSHFKLQVYVSLIVPSRKGCVYVHCMYDMYIYLYNNIHILYSWYIHCVQTESWRIWLLFSEVLLQNQSVRKSFVKGRCLLLQ